MISPDQIKIVDHLLFLAQTKTAAMKNISNSAEPNQRKRQVRHFRFWTLPALLLPFALVGPNALIGVYALVIFSAGIALLWRPDEPPILLLIFVYQWVQSASGALYGNAIGVPLADLVYFTGHHDFAAFLMLTGTVVLAWAMRAPVGKLSLDLHYRTKVFLSARTFKFWLNIYLAAWIFSAACAAIAPIAGGLKLIFLTLSDVKWAAFVLLTCAAFSGLYHAARTKWFVVFAIEFMLSLGGFFANFKEVFLFALFGLAASNIRLKPKVLFTGASLGVALLGLSLVWTAIKLDYRAFANAGTGQQIVLVDYGEGLGEMARLIVALDSQSLWAAVNNLVGRLMYHHYFGTVTANVPSSLPHTNGEIWGEAVSRPFMPRLLFPEKRAIHDSDLTNQYTGLGVATAVRGVSISLGYMAEAYIDFGPFLMFVAIAMLGAGIGFFYRWLLVRPGSMAVVGVALAPFALMPAHLAETSILKLIPTLFLTLLSCIVVIHYLAPMALSRRRRKARRAT